MKEEITPSTLPRQIVKTGRDLDAEVAERVMGWKHYQSQRGLKLTFFLSPEIYATHYIQSQSLVEVSSGNEENAPRYSESIEAAMQVVEKLGDVTMVKGHGLWFAEFCKADKPTGNGRSVSLPEAICRAALSAVDSQ